MKKGKLFNITKMATILVLLAVFVCGSMATDAMARTVPPGVTVNTVDELRTYLAHQSASVIIMGSNITVGNTDPKLVLNHSVTIYGQGKVLDLNKFGITMPGSGSLTVYDLAMRTTDTHGFFTAYNSTSVNGIWNVAFDNTAFMGTALVGQRVASPTQGAIYNAKFTGNNDFVATGSGAVFAMVFAANVTIDSPSFNMTGANNSIYFKSTNSSGVGSGSVSYGTFEVTDNSVVNIRRGLSSTTSNTYNKNLIEGYESYVFGANSVFNGIAGTNTTESNKGYAQTAILHSASTKDFLVKSGAQVTLVSDYSLVGTPASHGSTAISLRKPAGGVMSFTVEPGAKLDVVAYGTNARSRDLAPVLILSKVAADRVGISNTLIKGEMNIYSHNGNGWYYQYVDYGATGFDTFTVDGGKATIFADGGAERSTAAEYSAFEHYGPVALDVNVINSGEMNIRTNGWRAMSMAAGTNMANPVKKITVKGAGSKMYIHGGQFAITAEGRTVFEMNVLDGGFISTHNTQDSNIYTVGQATYNVDGAGSRLEMVRTGVSAYPSRTNTTLYGVIFHDAPLIGPLTINVTNGAYMSADDAYGSRAAITTQSHYYTNHSINVSGKDSTLRVVNKNNGTAPGNDTSLYPVGAIAFAANCSGNINISNGANFFAESNSPDSPTIALGSYGNSKYSGMLTLDKCGDVDIKNNAYTYTKDVRAIALRGRNYDLKKLDDTTPTLVVKDTEITTWPVGLGTYNWPEANIVDTWERASFVAFNSVPVSVLPGKRNNQTMFDLAKYGRINGKEPRFTLTYNQSPYVGSGDPFLGYSDRYGNITIASNPPEYFTGRAFVGWHPDPDAVGNGSYRPGNQVVITQDMSVYAIWAIED